MTMSWCEPDMLSHGCVIDAVTSDGLRRLQRYSTALFEERFTEPGALAPPSACNASRNISCSIC